MADLKNRIEIREMTVSDVVSVTSLNKTVVSVTSPMDTGKFRELFSLSTASTVAVLDSACVGFLIAIEHGRDYANDNYRWFSDSLDNFLYIDRVVVSSTCRGLGVGSLLYGHLSDAARRGGFQCIAAEIDVEPPNQPSLRFHEKMGFVEIGTRELTSGKRVSMQFCRLDKSG